MSRAVSSGISGEDCPGCVKREFDLSPEAVAALVDQIPISPELKADEELLAKRLAACLACDALRGGVLCAFCGCFIRFRARARKAYCPHPAGGKWPIVIEYNSLINKDGG